MRDIMRVTCSTSKELRQEVPMMDALSVTRHTVVTTDRGGGRPGAELCTGETRLLNKCHQSSQASDASTPAYAYADHPEYVSVQRREAFKLQSSQKQN